MIKYTLMLAAGERYVVYSTVDRWFFGEKATEAVNTVHHCHCFLRSTIGTNSQFSFRVSFICLRIL